MKMTTSSSAGSTQNRVLARPPQLNSPTEPRVPLATESSRLAKPRPKPMPSLRVSLKLPRAQPVRSPPSGRWLLVIMARVRGPMMRVPSSSPPFNSMLQKR